MLLTRLSIKDPPHKKGGGHNKKGCGGHHKKRDGGHTLAHADEEPLSVTDSPRKGGGTKKGRGGTKKKRGGGHTLALGGEEPLKPVEVVVANRLVRSVEV